MYKTRKFNPGGNLLQLAKTVNKDAIRKAAQKNYTQRRLTAQQDNTQTKQTKIEQAVKPTAIPTGSDDHIITTVKYGMPDKNGVIRAQTGGGGVINVYPDSEGRYDLSIIDKKRSEYSDPADNELNYLTAASVAGIPKLGQYAFNGVKNLGSAIIEWLPKLSFSSAYANPVTGEIPIWATYADGAFTAGSTIPTIYDIQNNGLNLENGFNLGLGLVPVVGNIIDKTRQTIPYVKDFIQKGYNYFNSPYGLRFGNFAYSPDRSVLTSGFPKLNATKVGNATPEELRQVEQIRSQFSKLPSQDEVLQTIRDTASKNGITMAESNDDGSIVFRLGKQKVETSPGVWPESADITVTNSIHWPQFLNDAGINAPVVTQFDMIPVKGGTFSRKNSMSMARIDNALPSGTIIVATPEIQLHKDIMRQAVAHSNLSPEEKVMLFRKIDSDNTLYLPDDGNLSADSYNMILKKSLQKTNKGQDTERDTYRLFGGQEIEVLNRLSQDPNNPLKMFIEPRLGKNFSAGQVLDYNIKDGFGKYVRENYPALQYSDDSVEVPLIYLQKRRFGGKLNKKFK